MRLGWQQCPGAKPLLRCVCTHGNPGPVPAAGTERLPGIPLLFWHKKECRITKPRCDDDRSQHWEAVTAKRHRGTADVAAELQEDVAATARQGLDLRNSPRYGQGTRGQGESRAQQTLCDFTLNSGHLHSSHSSLCPSPTVCNRAQREREEARGKSNPL